jgi:transposase
VKILHERVAGIDVHKDMIKVAVRSPGDKPWTRKTEIFTFRTFYGVLKAMARELRGRAVTHVVMEASGVYTEPVYYALCEEDFTEVAVVNPAHAKALKGHKTDAKDCARLAELFECGLLRGSYLPAPELKEVRDLTRYRALCRHRHRIRYAEARIMPSSQAACRRRVVAGVKTSA